MRPSLSHIQRRHLARLAGLSLLIAIGIANAAAIPAHSDLSTGAAGVYVLTKADGRPLPYPFRADLGSGEVTGDLTGARLTLRPDGRYEADLLVRVDPGIFANLPGVPETGVKQVVHDQGAYAASKGKLTLEPAGMLTRRYDAQLFGRYDDSTIALTSADVRAKGERYVLSLDLRRVR
jgi:hypothetical protein